MRSACLFLLLCTIAVPTGAGAQDRDPVAELTALGESLLHARWDTDDNASDFVHRTPPDPQNASSAAETP